jgi:hypothetical protein
MCLAFAAALLPESWMAAAHARLSLGEFPAAPLTDYLTRSISLLYGIHGGLFLVLSTHLPRYAPVVRYMMWMHIVFGASVLAIDLWAGMPWWWTGLEGPSIAGFALLNLYLLRFVPVPRPA